MFYLTHTPWWLKKIYPTCIWDIPVTGKTIFLTFDDGPHETATPFVLQQLELYKAKATFFCIGKNVAEHPEILKQIKADGHAVANHTMHHTNGCKTNDDAYLKEIADADALIGSTLFRPPYGRIKRSQILKIQGSRNKGQGTRNKDQDSSFKDQGSGSKDQESKSANQTSDIRHQTSEIKVQESRSANQTIDIRDQKFEIIMWSVLSGDFDTEIDGEKCFQNVIRKIKPGSIIVFHDSRKALPRLQYALPKLLRWMQENGYVSEAIGVSVS